jgi:hypothetical protein
MHPSDGSIKEALERGAQSLRKNSYIQIVGNPELKTFGNSKLNTFIAPILCLLGIPENKKNKVIRYNAHVGPMLNTHRIISYENEYKFILEKLENDFALFGYSNDAKKNYLNYFKFQKSIIYINESRFAPNYNIIPRPIEIAWTLHYNK